MNGSTPTRSGVTDVVAIGFSQTVAMWGVGYVCRLSPGVVPSWLLLSLMLVCMAGGGTAAGRLTGRGWRGGVAVGVVSAALNLMILGSLLGGDRPNQIVPSALWWVPGSLFVGGLLGGAGAALAEAFAKHREASVHWTGVLAWTAVAACLLLLTAGGMVTSKEAGLAVVDWPNSFGYNMFLYPLSRMTGGIYYEHAHRLLGSLLGLTVIALSVHLWRSDPRGWVRWVVAAVLVLVIVQGLLGGLRVTGRLTLSVSRSDMAPSIRLAALHGVLGQVIFASLVALGALTSRRWTDGGAVATSQHAATDRTLQIALPVMLVAQLIFGAILRHTYVGLTVHIALAVLVTVLAVACGLRAWGLYRVATVTRLGMGLVSLTAVQVVLGIGALVTTGALALRKPPPTVEVVFATVHQVVGAVLLGCSVLLLVWHRRLVSSGES